MARGMKERHVDASTNSSREITQSTLLSDTPRPQSKTSIGRLTWSIPKTPELLVVQLMVESEVVNLTKEVKWQPLSSKKLRRLVAAEYMGTAGQVFDLIHIPREAKEGTVYAIIRVRDEQHRAAVKARLDVDVPKDSSLTKNTRQHDGGLLQCKIHCTVVYLIDEFANTKIYLEALLLDIARKPGLLRPLTGLPKTVDARLHDTTSDTTSAFQLHVQVQPRVDAKKIHLDFTLVSCIPTMPISNLLSKVLGINEPNLEEITQNFDTIKRILCGLTVRCIYKPNGRSETGLAKVKLLLEDDKTGRVFQIRDVKLSSDPETAFKINGVSTSVYSYFSDVTLLNGRTLNTNFPLAQDHTGAWIPLDLLISNGLQPLHGFGHRNQAMRDSIQAFLKKGGINCLRTLGKELLEKYATIRSDNSSGSQPWLNATPVPATDASTGVVKAGRIKIAFVSPTGAPDTELIKRFTRGLLSHQYSVMDVSLMVAGDGSLDQLESPKCDLLLVVVDDRKPNQDHSREVVSRLRRVAELEWGSRVICLNRNNLLNLFDNRYDPGTYLPSSIRLKIDHLLGQQNFSEAQLQKALGSGNTMIAGAHLAHPSNNEVYCPSIAAVVATTPGSVVQYAGTARLQTTTKTPPKEVFGNHQPVACLGERTRRHIEPKIKDLQAMMHSLFENWQNGAPTELIFFRDSAGLEGDLRILTDEYAQIKAAYQAVFSKQIGETGLALTYIQVTKDAPGLTKSSSLSQYQPDGSDSKNYRYIIIKSDGNLDLPEITARINESSQLNAQIKQTAKALPLLHASKLCGRMQDYVSLSVTLPTVSRIRLPTTQQVIDMIDVEKKTVEKANAALGIDTSDKESRQVPWHKNLDGTMFYL